MPASYQDIQGIKVVALDIYGTVLATDDCDNTAKPRKGLADFFDKCDAKGIKIASTSDAYIPSVKLYLSDCFERHPKARMCLERFDNFFKLNQLPTKDFSIVIGHYDIATKELLVIGDNPIKDIGGASKLGCLSILVPEYRLGNRASFDFSKIPI